VRSILQSDAIRDQVVRSDPTGLDVLEKARQITANVRGTEDATADDAGRVKELLRAKFDFLIFCANAYDRGPTSTASR
jgi:hypothetical protein